MNPAVAAHEQFMNASRTIPPRVGGGVGVGGGWRGSIQDQTSHLTVGGALRAIGFGASR